MVEGVVESVVESVVQIMNKDMHRVIMKYRDRHKREKAFKKNKILR